jgi:hypothetical protein
MGPFPLRSERRRNFAGNREWLTQQSDRACAIDSPPTTVFLPGWAELTESM